MKIDACAHCESGRVKPLHTWYVCEDCGLEFTAEQYAEIYKNQSIADWEE